MWTNGLIRYASIIGLDKPPTFLSFGGRPFTGLRVSANFVIYADRGEGSRARHEDGRVIVSRRQFSTYMVDETARPCHCRV